MRKPVSKVHITRKQARSIGIVRAWVVWHMDHVGQNSRRHLAVLCTARKSQKVWTVLRSLSKYPRLGDFESRTNDGPGACKTALGNTRKSTAPS